MIHDLNTALALNTRRNIAEFVVSRNVFLEVLRRRKQTSDSGFLVVNSPYDSVSIRFFNKVLWRGIIFIYVSNEAISNEVEAASIGT